MSESANPCEQSTLGPRERILCEAIRLFGRRGYSATSVREVVEAAGVTKPTLYYYFANKEALFVQCLETQLGGLAGLIDATLASPGSERERLAMFLQLFVDGGLQQQDSVRLMAKAHAGFEPGQPQVALGRAFSEQMARLSPLFQGDTEIAVTVFSGLATELLFRSLDGEPPPRNYVERVLDLLFLGMEPRE